MGKKNESFACDLHLSDVPDRNARKERRDLPRQRITFFKSLQKTRAFYRATTLQGRIKVVFMSRQTKYIFITGGVASSLGKGIAAASVGALMEDRGLAITLLKMDPYINVDPGTMSPTQHGEVFVTQDGAETDLDLGHYERFTSAVMSKNNNFTSGQIYESVIDKERRGEYLGRTVQVIPHVTNEIKARIRKAAVDCDVAICEVGGTVGDIEGLPFLEAIRQFRFDVGRDNVLYLHLTLVPFLKTAGELKTKPTQHSVKELRSIGIQPDLLLCRSEQAIPQDIKDKIALFCNIAPDEVISVEDVDTIYAVPLLLLDQGLDQKIADKLNIWSRPAKLKIWDQVVDNLREPQHHLTIGIVGKYVELTESYKSLNEALIHGGVAHNSKVKRLYVDAEDIIQGKFDKFDELDGILVPGGFGERGSEGKIRAVEIARTKGIPFLGICLGMQMAVVEYARNVCNMTNAHSVEMSPNTAYPVIDWMEGQKDIERMGATMRLGSYPCKLKPDSIAATLYNAEEVDERHRHRYEVNNKFRERLEADGLVLSGLSPDESLVEMIELPEEQHPFFVGCQFHPEFCSRPFAPHPLFAGFIEAALKQQLQRKDKTLS